jgi:hypothetical protein
MLTFKLLIINDVDVWKTLLTAVLTFNLLAINDVALVDLYMRYASIHILASAQPAIIDYSALWNEDSESILNIRSPGLGDFITVRHLNHVPALALAAGQWANNSQMLALDDNLDVFTLQAWQFELYHEFVFVFCGMNQTDVLCVIDCVNQIFAAGREQVIASAVIVIHRRQRNSRI